jgi:hypothetical protein
MNSHYSGSGFSFYLSSTTRTSNSNWFKYANYGNSYQTAMKKALHTGNAATLNVYTVGFTDGTLGYATFPWSYSGNPVDDGVVILYSTVPGGSESFITLILGFNLTSLRRDQLQSRKDFDSRGRPLGKETEFKWIGCCDLTNGKARLVSRLPRRLLRQRRLCLRHTPSIYCHFWMPLFARFLLWWRR